MLLMAGLTGSNRERSLKADDQHHISSLKSTRQPPEDHQTKFIGSPRLFRHLLTNSVENGDTPTSMLDAKLAFSPRSPSAFDKNAINSPRQSSAGKHTWGNSGSSAIGLAILTSADDDPVGSPKIATRGSVFGTHLRVHIPPSSPTTPSSDSEFSKSPFDFGTKTRNSPFYSPSSSFRKMDTPKVLTRQLSVTDMVLSEEYTCVTSHGPNPKTTHIFDNFVVENYSGPLSQLESKRIDYYSSADDHSLDDASNGSGLWDSRDTDGYCGKACGQKNTSS